MKQIVIMLLIIGGAWSGYALHTSVPSWLVGLQSWWASTPYYSLIYMVLGGGVALFAALVMHNRWIQMVQTMRERWHKYTFFDILIGLLGLVGGALLAQTLMLTFFKDITVPLPLLVAINTFLIVIVSRILWQRRAEIRTILGLTTFFKAQPTVNNERQSDCKILDTSVIIDGRIADLCRTGFIEGTVIIPEFVLEELQHIADSADLLKRNRGRRGLDILNKMQKELSVPVTIYEGRLDDQPEVDSKLIKLAKRTGGKVVTNDFNLNKVCELQGVSVLNINDLANAIKPVVLPGEEMTVSIVKDGKENGQGVAYLDDGTMIVVDGGKEYIGVSLNVIVTSVLQTSAGRMIFARLKMLEKAL
jgi:uncharacterized protein YacL